MTDLNLASAYYTRLIYAAEVILKGPSSLQVGDDFWGEPNLILRCEAAPKIEGVITSRTVYANICDDEQHKAILRHAAWDARESRQNVWRDSRIGKPLFELYPAIGVHYVWIDIDWLHRAIRNLEALVVPVQAPQANLVFSKRYGLGIQYSDRTSIQVMWGKGTLGRFGSLESIWESLWQQTPDLLRHRQAVIPDEVWDSDSIPSYERKPFDLG